MSQSRTSTDMLWKDPGNKEASLIFYFESGPWHWHIEDLYILIKCSSNATSSSCWRSPLKLLGDNLLWNPLAMSRWVRRGGTQKKTWNGKYFCSQLTQLVFYLDCNFLFGSIFDLQNLKIRSPFCNRILLNSNPVFYFVQ